MKKPIISLIAIFMTVCALSAQTDKARAFQIGFISPLGTNGIQSGQIINYVSINLLGGYSKGNKAFELGGLYNINTYLTQGLQIAGIANWSGYSENALQIGGIMNVITDGSAIMQIGGVVNKACGINGVQIGGLVNVANNIRGLQLGGAVSVSEDVAGVQIGGLTNVAGNIKGFQLAGIANVTDDMRGFQLGGLVNVAKDMHGFQLGCLVNVAKKLRGFQFGLVNYADESDGGVAFGLINIVRKGGKHEVEVSVSEAINTAVSFRLGTDRLYTIFSAGANYFNKPVNYAVGIGFGSHFDWKKGWGNQVELMGYSLTEQGSFSDVNLNMLAQLKLTFSKEFAPHFKVFAGPVLNMTISSYVNPQTGAMGSSLAPWSMWKNTSDNLRLNGWIGGVVGVRF